MKYLDRSEAEVHVACTTASPDNPAISARKHISSLQDVSRIDVDFGREFRFQSRLRWLLTAPGALFGIARLLAYSKRRGIEVIHSSEKPRDIATALLVGRLVGAKVVLHLHVAPADWMSPLTRLGLKQADRVIAISDFVAGEARKWGVRSDRIMTVHNAIDVDDARWNGPDAREAVRAELQIPQDAPVIGAVSRLFHWKGHERLLAALPHVRAELPDALLVIVGEDDPRASPGAPPFSRVLRDQAAALGMESALVFTGFRSDVARMMDCFDVFALPSWDEPFGVVYLEAMIRNRPAIALNRGGPREVIRSGETGYLVEPDDPQALAAVLVKLLRSPELRERVAAAARADLFARFTSRHMADGVLSVYRSALAG
jgi:glycosyltransferase involved in cell wall biosynthesis